MYTLYSISMCTMGSIAVNTITEVVADGRVSVNEESKTPRVRLAI